VLDVLARGRASGRGPGGLQGAAPAGLQGVAPERKRPPVIKPGAISAARVALCVAVRGPV